MNLPTSAPARSINHRADAGQATSRHIDGLATITADRGDRYLGTAAAWSFP